MLTLSGKAQINQHTMISSKLVRVGMLIIWFALDVIIIRKRTLEDYTMLQTRKNQNALNQR